LAYPALALRTARLPPPYRGSCEPLRAAEGNRPRPGPRRHRLARPARAHQGRRAGADRDDWLTAPLACSMASLYPLMPARRLVGHLRGRAPPERSWRDGGAFVSRSLNL